MLTSATTKPTTQHLTKSTSPVRITESSNPDIGVRISRPTNTALAVHIDGELDARTTPRVHEILASKTNTTAGAIILDLSELCFLAVAGLELIEHIQHAASHNDTIVCLVDGPPCVDRALRAAGWNEIPRYSTVAAAAAEVTGRTRHSPAQPAYITG